MSGRSPELSNKITIFNLAMRLCFESFQNSFRDITLFWSWLKRACSILLAVSCCNRELWRNIFRWKIFLIFQSSWCCEQCSQLLWVSNNSIIDRFSFLLIVFNLVLVQISKMAIKKYSFAPKKNLNLFSYSQSQNIHIFLHCHIMSSFRVK